ncbi:MAG: DDE-type integrase/transposase/recombinase [Planctomycetota bacterium]|nr:DDE-type integrase/transposase/recombinase [Planctomycetota bacterium]
MRQKFSLPRGWNRHVKSSILQVLSLAHYCFSIACGGAAQSRVLRVRMQAEIDHLGQEIALLQEELRIKDKRMMRILSARRVRYTPMERMAILELRATRGWSALQTARRFLLSHTTIADWMKRIDEGGPRALLQIFEPVNKFPDLVRYIVQRLKILCPRLGKVKIAQTLCRAGLHLAPATVGRMLKEKPVFPEPKAEALIAGPIVKAKGPNHIWHVDLTAVPTSAGFWTAWLPFALPQQWPFCWWVAVVVDHFSRRVQGVMIFERRPSSRDIRSFLGRAIRQAAATPRYLISDKGSQFFCEGFMSWCERRGIRLRFGAVGKHGSVAIVERFILSMKSECTRVTPVPLGRERFRRELSFYVGWFNGQRAHTFLGVRTPDEIYHGLPAACNQPRLELRPRWPRNAKCASPQAPVDRETGPAIRFEVTFLGGRRHLPVVSLRRAA